MKQPDNRILVAMSGGVDSAVAAALLLEQGWQVLGVNILLAAKPQEPSSLQSLCRFLGIQYKQVDFRSEFNSQVIRYFVDAYRAGQTPNPCVRCNEQIKFGALLKLSRSWGFTSLATGHYARTAVNSAGVSMLLRGLDTRKDQSYFLHRLNPEALASCLFPLGELTKVQVQEKSAALGLTPFLPGRESQELCFITGNYADLLRELGEEGLNRSGPIVNRRREVLGQHRGLEHYTVGQRQGLGVPAPAPYYVLELNPELNQLVVGYKEELQASALVVADINWLIPPPREPLSAAVRLRYRHPGAGCLITPIQPASARITLDQPQTAITPGQAAVFYQGDQVLGGGWIVRSLPL